MSAATPLDLDPDDIAREVMRGDSSKLEVTIYDREDRPRGRRIATTWEAWGDELERRMSLPRDDAGPGWSPGTFAEDHRAKKNVERIYAIGLDLEPKTKGEPDPLRLGDPEKVIRVFGAWLGFVHTTRSHRDDAPRTRAVLVTDRPMTLEEHAAIWPLVSRRAEDGGLRSDPAPKDASRLWYYGCTPASGAAPFFARLDGRPLPVDEMLEQAARAMPEIPATSGRGGISHSSTTSATDDGPGRYARRALESAVGRLHLAQSGERNDTLAREAYGVAQAYRAARLPMSEARSALRTAIGGWDPNYMAKHEATLDRQLDEGAKLPRSIPERRPMSPANDQRSGNSGGSGGGGDGPRERRQKPTIHVTAGGLGEIYRAALDVLPHDPELYQRAGKLTRIVTDLKPSKREQAAFVAGAPRLVSVELSYLRVRFAELATWTKTKASGEVIPSRPDDDAISAVHTAGGWADVRPIVGLSEVPVMRPDGSIHDVPDTYDARTGYVLVGGGGVGKIPDRPTRADATQAYNFAAEPFAEFPWAAGDLGAAVCVAAVATIVCRPAIEGPTPAFLANKNTPGTGGSLCTDVIALEATGRIAPRLSWPKDPAEVGKTIDAAAVGGARIVNFDNVSPAHPLAGAAIDKVLTSEEVEIRILGKTRNVHAQWLAVFMASGNNMLVCGDTTRRVLVADMETSEERPQDRSGFRHPDLRAYVAPNHHRYVRAILTMVRAYVVAGRPDPVQPWGSFEAWAALIASAIRWASGVNVLDARLEVDKSGDPELAAHVALLDGLGAFVPDKEGRGVSLRGLLAALYPGGKVPTDGPPDTGADAMREALETLSPPRVPGRAPDVHALGNALRRFRHVVRGGKRLTSKPHQGTAEWWVESVS